MDYRPRAYYTVECRLIYSDYSMWTSTVVQLRPLVCDHELAHVHIHALAMFVPH